MRKMMTMKRALHSRSVVHKFYVARGSDEKGVIGWVDCFHAYIINKQCHGDLEQLKSFS